MSLTKIGIEVETAAWDKCSRCPGDKCCRYITQAIDTPRSIDDFDHLAWQMVHKNVQVYKDEDGWFLLVMNTCQFLQKDGRCAIYETRPQLCRDYSNDYCISDFTGGWIINKQCSGA